MTAGCARCGHCCAPVILSYPLAAVTAWAAPINDPRTDEGWERWTSRGWGKHHTREEVIARWEGTDGSTTAENAAFMREHWTQEWYRTANDESEGAYVVTCDMYDDETRLCTAGDGRPPICSGFPWYGQEPRAERLGWPIVELGPGDATHFRAPLACSYLADVPAADRPPNRRPLIPLEVL